MSCTALSRRAAYWILRSSVGTRPEIGTPLRADCAIVCGDSAPLRFGFDTSGGAGVVGRGSARALPVGFPRRRPPARPAALAEREDAELERVRGVLQVLGRGAARVEQDLDRVGLPVADAFGRRHGVRLVVVADVDEE